MYTYVQRPGCKKENTATYVYIRAGSRTPTRAYVRRGLVYMAGSERRNSVAVVFMGRNGMGGRVHREGLDKRGGKGPPTVETGVLLIGRGVAYRKTGLHGILFISTVDPLQPPRATVHPPSTSSSLHLRLFIHGLLFIQPPPRATPPATVQPALSTGSYSTTPPWATVHPALRRLLFILPSTGWSCSSSPPRGPVHPAPTGSIDRGPVHPEATPRGPVHPPPPGTVHPNRPPPTTLTVHQEAASFGFS